MNLKYVLSFTGKYLMRLRLEYVVNIFLWLKDCFILTAVEGKSSLLSWARIGLVTLLLYCNHQVPYEHWIKLKIIDVILVQVYWGIWIKQIQANVNKHVISNSAVLKRDWLRGQTKDHLPGSQSFCAKVEPRHSRNRIFTNITTEVEKSNNSKSAAVTQSKSQWSGIRGG